MLIDLASSPNRIDKDEAARRVGTEKGTYLFRYLDEGDLNKVCIKLSRNKEMNAQFDIKYTLKKCGKRKIKSEIVN